MKLKDNKVFKFCIRVLVYIIGLFFVAWGIAFSINSNLGISPSTSFPYMLDKVTGIGIQYTIIMVYVAYVITQIILLRKRFKLYNLFQVVFAILFGYMTDFTKSTVASISTECLLPTYFGQLAVMAFSLVLIAIGIMLYVNVSLVPMPAEGFALALAQVQNRFKFHHTKIFADCLSVTLAITLSFVFLGKLDGVREGTIITALSVGALVKVFQKPFKPFFAWLLDKKPDQPQPATATETAPAAQTEIEPQPTDKAE